MPPRNYITLTPQLYNRLVAASAKYRVPANQIATRAIEAEVMRIEAIPETPPVATQKMLDQRTIEHELRQAILDGLEGIKSDMSAIVARCDQLKAEQEVLAVLEGFGGSME
jgi:hypothetical protein